MTPDLGDLRARLDAAMERRGAWPDRSPWLRPAMAALPRDRFAPDVLWRWDGTGYVPIHRDTDPDGWAGELFADQDAAAVTQVTAGLPSSSLSAPAVVADMLDSLLIDPGHQVWDVGTGQGWSAALAAWRAGPGRVVSTELDEDLADFARARLRAAGVRATVVAANATSAQPPGGDQVDRIHATYAVETVPFGWVEATRPGGRIVYPWGRLGHVALTVAADGRSASGWVQGLGMFMADRSAPAPRAASGWSGYAAVRGTDEPETERTVARDLLPLSENWDLKFGLRVAVPRAQVVTGTGQWGTCAWIHDGDRSWAALSAQHDGTALLHQGGPRRLGDRLLAAWDQWNELGRPSRYDYGITVTRTEQWAWLQDAEAGPRWPITPPLAAPAGQ
ncbi:protein-L-isoaspartate O-methyltransferase family protein [Kitasatospora sp. HPMI-4]|uniref:protein-L-isoaspartate O-methyltransferase family protein n=1 Tax=Kitasatospora sp. HPMI-4 TaxID=3448443 RepID=UPI003F1C2EAA